MEAESTTEDRFMKDRDRGFEKNYGPFIAQKGCEYQMKIAELFVSLSLKKENFRYNLSMEDKSAGKFDDVVFNVLKQGQYICWFLQAKHREGDAKITWDDLLYRQNGDFLLKTYFKSFLNFREKIGPADASVSRYVIYTPALLDFHNNQPDEDFSCIPSGINSLRFRKVTEEHDLLDATRYFMYKLQPDHFIKCHLKERCDATDEDVEIFLEHLRFAVGQPKVEKLSDILLNKFKDAIAHIDPLILRDNISRDMRKFFMKYTSKSKYFTEIETGKIILLVLSQSCKNSFLLDVNFSSSDLMDKSLRCNKCVVHISTCNPRLCCNKLINHPNGCKQTILLHFHDLVEARDVVLPCLPFEKELLMIIVCDLQGESEMSNETFQSLVKCFTFSRNQTEASNEDRQSNIAEQETSVWKLVFVSSSSFGVCSRRMPELHKHIFCVKDETYSLKSLSCESQDLIMKKQVKFQGNPLCFNKLCSEYCMPPFDSLDIETLLSDPNITLGKHATSDENKLEIFISRKFYVKTITLSCLDNLVNEIFLVVSSSVSALWEGKPNIHSVSIEKADEMFAELRQKFPSKRIHKLKLNVSSCLKQNVTLQWLETHGTADALFKYINENESLDVAGIEPNPIAIVAAEPGMGKTTLLSHIAEEENKNHSDRWVVNVRLKDVASKLLNLNPSDNISYIAKCLSEAFLEGESLLSKHLFQHSLEVKGNFIFLLDGYDEIASKEEREKVRFLLQSLKENSLGQVIITTRLHFKKELELTVSAIAYRLKPLTATEQEMLLAETWIKNLGVSSNEDKTERVHVCARELVEDFSQKVGEGIKSLIGIPLLVTLLGEVYEEKCNIYCNMEVPLVESVIVRTENILMLYRSFEEKKVEDFCAHELNLSTQINLRNKIFHDHRNVCAEVALEDLFPYTGFPCDCCVRRKPRILEILEEDEILRIGILQKIGGRRLTFIHRTFAEYFFTMYQLLQMKTCCKKFAKAFKNEFHNIRFCMVRLFLDIALATSRIHKAALTNDVETIEKELENGNSINLRDALGRTPCHLAASRGHVEAAEFLLTMGCNTRIKDGLHKYTIVEVAAKVGKWEICSLFLSKGRNIKLSIEEKCTLFRYLCNNGEAEPLEQMLNDLEFRLMDILQFKQIFYSRDERGNTGLIIALLNGNNEVLRILLDKCKEYYVDSSENDLIKCLIAFPSCDLVRLNACVKLLIDKVIARNCCRNLTEELDINRLSLYTVQAVSTLIVCLLECEISLKEVAWSALLYGKVSDLEKVFTKVGEVHNDIASFILQPFESHETMLHFAAVYGTMHSVIFLIRQLGKKGENILRYILSQDLQQLSLIHYAVKRNHIELCDIYIQEIRNREVILQEYIFQEDNHGKTPLHWAAYHRNMNMVEFLILKMKDQQTSVFQGRTKLPLVTRGTSSNETQLFEILFQEITKHGNNVLAYILKTDSTQRNSLHYLEVDNYKHYCSEKPKINGGCCVEWIREQMNSEIVKLFQVLSAPYSVENFINFIFHKIAENRKTLIYFVTSENFKKENALTLAVSHKQFETFEILAEEIEKEGGRLEHFVGNNENSEYKTLIALSVKCGSIQILEFILKKVNHGGDNIAECYPKYVQYILSTFSECLLTREISSSQLEADFMMLLKDDPRLMYFLHGLAKFCDIIVLRTYFEIIRQIDGSLEYYITRRNDNGITSIHCAAEVGRKEVVEYLLEEVEKECGDCSHCFYPNEEGWTLLHSAAVGGNTYLVGFLMNKIREYRFNTLAYILLETTGGQSAIHCASSNGQAKVVKLLLTFIEMRSCVFLSHILSKQEYKNTLMCNAASHGDAKLLDFIVQKRTKKVRKSNVPNSGSHRKAFPKYTSNLKEMKSKNRLRKSRNVYGFDLKSHEMSPLYLAIRHDNVQVVQYLFENVGRKTDKIIFVENLVSCFHGTNTRSPFHYAHFHEAWKSLSYLIQLVTNSRKYLTSFLYNRDQHGKTLLHYSILSGNTSVSTLLMQTMSEEEGEDIFRWSMWSSMTLEEFLDSLLKKRNIELFLHLIRLIQKDRGSIMSLFTEQTDTDKSVTCYMAKYVDREVLEFLLKELEKEGGNIFHYLSTRDRKGQRLLEETMVCNNYEAAGYLIGQIKERGRDVVDYFCKEDFIRRIKNKAMDELKNNNEELVTNYEYLNVYLRKSHANALKNNETEVANLLLNVAGSINQNFLNYLPHNVSVETQIGLAIKAGSIEMLDSIFRRIGDLSIAVFLESPHNDMYRRNAFHVAAMSGYKNVMEFLFRKVKQERGESCSLASIISGRDNKGNTPFYYAVRGGHIELVKFLLETIKGETLSNDHCTRNYLE